jgi:hypothetical protein
MEEPETVISGKYDYKRVLILETIKKYFDYTQDGLYNYTIYKKKNVKKQVTVGSVWMNSLFNEVVITGNPDDFMDVTGELKEYGFKVSFLGEGILDSKL